MRETFVKQGYFFQFGLEQNLLEAKCRSVLLLKWSFGFCALDQNSFAFGRVINLKC